MAQSSPLTVVLAEGRRMMRLSQQLAPEQFEALLHEYQRLLRGLFEGMGGHDVEVSGDSVVAVFSTAKEAALAAGAAHQALAVHKWPTGPRPAISVGLDSADLVGEAARRCSDLCDAVEAGQIFLSPATASQLEHEDLGGLKLRDLGERRTRRTERTIRAYELLVCPPRT